MEIGTDQYQSGGQYSDGSGLFASHISLFFGDTVR